MSEQSADGIDRLNHPAPKDADYEVACWKCDEPSPADVFAIVDRNAANRETRIRSGHAVCQSHLEELKNDDDTEVTVLEDETRTVRGANHSRSLAAATEQQEVGGE